METKTGKEKEKENRIYQHLKDAFPSQNSYKEILNLDLSGSMYNILNLDELEKDPEYRTKFAQINFLDVSKNSLSVLRLKGYNNLERIIGINNFITKVELNLPRLKRIDLSSNLISKMFELNSVTCLEEIILNKNQITKITWEDFKPVKSSLVTFEINNNKIEFGSVKVFFDFAESFGKSMKKLRNLSINENTFTKSKIYRDYNHVFLNYCTSLKTLNSNAIDSSIIEEKKDLNQIKNNMLKLEKNAETNQVKDLIEENDQNINSKNVSLIKISDELERCNSYGNFSQSNVQFIVTMIEEYLSSSSIKGSLDKIGKEEDIIEDPELNLFENIVEYTELLINSNESLEKLFIEIILKFSLIKNGKFASKSLSFLKSRLSPEKAKDIEDVLVNTVITFIINTEEDKIHQDLISGCESFLIDPKFYSILSRIIPKLIQIVINYRNMKVVGFSTENKKKKQIYSEAISFLVQANNDPNIISLLLENQLFIESISIGIRNILFSDELSLCNDVKAMNILIKQLAIVNDLCMSNLIQNNKNFKENIMKMVGSGIKDKLEQSLSPKFSEIQKKRTNESSSIEKKENLLNKRLIFANLIRSYGSILRQSNEIIKFIVDNSQTPSKIFNLIVQNVTNDPILISAACDFVLSIFQNEFILNNKDNVFEKICKKLFGLRYVLPFIGYNQEEFKSACIIAELYGDNTIIKGKPIELKSMNSKIIHDLFKSIINLIQFYQKFSVLDSPIKEICLSVCNDLNEQNRDIFLCNALSVPSENVKFSAVKCLYWVDSNQFSVDEITQIYSQVKNISLIGGVIEKVVSIIFLFLTRCFISYMNKSPEKVNQNKEAFTMAFELLQKNLENSSNSQTEVSLKNDLSVSIITFLINLSSFSQIKKLYIDRTDNSKIGRILSNEVKKHFFEDYIPLEIEKCRTGINIDNLYSLFTSHKSNPYSYVILRILIHISDLLMNIPFKSYELHQDLDYFELISLLRIEYLKRESERIQIEKENFQTIFNKKKEKLNYNQSLGYLLLDEQELIEEQQKYINILPDILSFILGRSDKNEIFYFETCWNDKFDRKYDSLKYSSSTFPKEYMKKDQFNYTDEIKDENMVNVISTYKNYLREEEYYHINNDIDHGSQHDYILKDLPRTYDYGRDSNYVKRFPNEENPHNQYLRSLIVASFLRTLYALLEYSANMKIKEQTISFLFKGNTIKEISQLVDCTKLIDCNIATKYLIIMRYLLSNSKIFYSDSLANANFPNAEKMIENDFLNKLGIIAYTIKKTIKIYKNEFKLENDNHKLLLSEISIICLLISNELENIHYTEKVIKEQILQTMISFDLIKVFISAIKENMNYEANLFKNAIGQKKDEEDKENQEDNIVTSLQEDEILITMMYNIANIIGEYMSKCKEYSYSILEMMTRSYIFEKVNFRKTYLKEIIECNKFADFKSNLEAILKRKVFYAARGNVNFINKNISFLKLLILTENGIEFIETSKSDKIIDDYGIKKFKIFEEFTILYSHIEVIVIFEFEHRCLIRTQSGEIISFFFFKANTSNFLLRQIRFMNSKISIYKKTKIFDSAKIPISKVIINYNERPYLLTIKLKDKKKQINLLKLNNSETPITNPGQTTITPIIEKEDDYQDDPEKNKADLLNLESKLNNYNNENNSKIIILFGCVEIHHFLDFFSEIFSDTEFVPDGKVLIIKDDKILIYRELPSKWDKTNFNNIFENNISYDYSEKEDKCIGDFSNCYKLISEFSLSDVKKIQFRNADEIMFNTDNSDTFTIIKVFDDISYLKLKRALIPCAKNRGLEISDDPYSIIK